MSRFEVVPLPTDARFGAGDDVTTALLDAAARAGTSLVDGDVLCIASKVVSKAEGATTPLPAGDVHAARRTLTLEVARRVVAETPWVLVVETSHGFVCANAGIDTSNVAEGQALLLPGDPDASAMRIREAVRDRTGADVGIVITDTFGRPWRMGQTDVAIGAAGVVALRDDRGTEDLEGNVLEVTMIALADELAAAADLARTKADGTPFVLVRGLDVAGRGAASDLIRPAQEDVFRTGGPTTFERAVTGPRTPPWPTTDFVPTLVERAILAAGGPDLPATGFGIEDLTDHAPGELDGADVVLGFVADGSHEATFEVGRAYERARLVLEAHGLTVRWLGPGDAEERIDWPATSAIAEMAELRIAGVLVAMRA